MLQVSIIDFFKTRTIELMKYDVKTVKDFYAWERLSGWNITPSDALEINLKNPDAINAFYFDESNFKIMTAYSQRVAGRFTQYNVSSYEADDIMQQIYADLPFFNFYSRYTLWRSIKYCAILLAYGGIGSIKEYKSAVKITQCISLYYESRIGKDGDTVYLIDRLAAPNKYEPETAFFRAEENADEKESAEFAKIEKIIKTKLFKNFTRSQRDRFIEDLLKL